MSDAQSLTLPKPTARSKRKLRRPRRPTFEELWWLFFTGIAVGVAVADWLTPEPAHGVWATATAGIYWRAYQRARRRIRPSLALPIAVAIPAALIAIDAAGIR